MSVVHLMTHDDLPAVLEMASLLWPSDEPEALEREIASGFSRLYMLEFEIEHMTGKQSKELAHVKGPLDE